MKNYENKSIEKMDFSNKTLKNSNFKNANASFCNFFKADLEGSDFEQTNLNNASFRSCNLTSVNFEGAKLQNADLKKSNLTNIKGYGRNFYIFQEIIARLPINNFDESEWAMIGIINTHKTCYKTIKKRFGTKVLTLFKKLADLGWGEYYDMYKNEKT